MITDIAKKLDFPVEAVEALSAAFDQIVAGDMLATLYNAMDDWYFERISAWEEKMEKIADDTGINRYIIEMVFLLVAARPLSYIYKQNGLSEELYLAIMADLRCKLMECHKKHGVWGIFVADWFPWHYQLKRFALGRLQYEKIEARLADDLLGVRQGDIVYNCHIPNSGPLTPESVRDSMREAYRFYKDELNGGKMIVTCTSWLLYTPIIEKLGDRSNIKKFHNLFHIVNIHHSENNHDFWRVFYVDYSKEALDTVKAENSLQRTLIDHLQNGGTMGEGVGYLIVDENF